MLHFILVRMTGLMYQFEDPSAIICVHVQGYDHHVAQMDPYWISGKELSPTGQMFTVLIVVQMLLVIEQLSDLFTVVVYGVDGHIGRHPFGSVAREGWS